MSDNKPYTYVTMSINPDQAPCLRISLYTSDLRTRALVTESGRPYLALESDEAGVSVSTTGGGHVTPADVDTARQIFNAAARYLADCERLHAEQTATSQDPAQSGENAA